MSLHAMPEEEHANYKAFRDCVSDLVVRQLATVPTKNCRRTTKGRKNEKKQPNTEHVPEISGDLSSDAEELSEFIDYLALEIFTSLPPSLRTLTHSTFKANTALSAEYADPLPPTTLARIASALAPSVPDSLAAYSLLPACSSSDPVPFLSPILTAYIAHVTTPPPASRATRASACELCARDWIPLTYHHLIPRAAHAKAVKRGWHGEDALGNVAWLCRACHSMVHHVAGNEELARELYTVERLKGREEVRKFAEWVGRVRWKAR
ncbi:hypothetical protein BDY21DRAFT_376553 [Lineolata rhizophorae]|uniref:HNH domain-containing protein n=1 Tax=Lineolata rhizophorae TaxID=578093 RepID=A0A6A6PE21_9PEZI|nr:hypothetical protein BDY21DRAFT_376553 [Lineolata rhizophorae]